jgi:1,5-anhydro-D-fructose reductase (1,5-anhydro-D-mannitol-forming)
LTEQTIGWGIVGTSGWADHTFAPAVRAGGGVLVGACGSSREGSEAFARRHGTERSYADFDSLLADPDVQVVWVASPTDMHYQHATRALDAGKHVLVEKPMAVSLEDAEAMAAAATGSAQITAVGFQHRFNPSHQSLRELCRSERLGDLLHVRLHQFIMSDGLPSEWRQDPARSGGWAINDLGTHLLDLLRFLIGDVEVVGAALGRGHFHLTVDDVAVVILRTKAAPAASAPEPLSVAATMAVSTACEDQASVMEVFGSGGIARLRDSWPGGGSLTVGSDPPHTYSIVDTYGSQARALNQAVEGSPYPGATWNDGMENVRLVTQARRVAATSAKPHIAAP